MRPLIAFAAIAAFAFCASPMLTAADAKTYQVHYHNQATLKSLCKKGGGKFNSGSASYSCTYKNGNVRECNRDSKQCIVDTPKRIVGPPSGPQPRGKPGVAVIPPVGGGILDGGPGSGTPGPASTGAPLSTGRGSAPSPGKIN
jgi:hypothetical protein